MVKLKKMKIMDVRILENVKINQNVVCLIVSFVFLWYSKDCCCCHKWLYDWSRVLFYVSAFSVIVSSFFYLYDYCKKKYYRAKERKIDYENKKNGNTSNRNSSITICHNCPKIEI